METPILEVPFTTTAVIMTRYKKKQNGDLGRLIFNWNR